MPQQDCAIVSHGTIFGYGIEPQFLSAKIDNTENHFKVCLVKLSSSIMEDTVLLKNLVNRALL